MDTVELIRKCQAVVLKEEEEDIVNFMGRMKIKGEETAANCLVGKVLLSRSINREGLKAAMHQAWKTVKEVKIESMGITFSSSSLPQKKRKRGCSWGDHGISTEH